MKKPLVIIDQDPELFKLKEDLEKGYKMYNSSLKFLKKQIEENHKKMVDPIWDDIIKVIADRNILPSDYSEKKYSLVIADGVLYLEENGTQPNIVELLLN